MQIIIYKKRHKGKVSGSVGKYLGTIQFGYFGLKAVSTGILTSKQIETARRVISRVTKRVGKVVIRVFFYQPLTKKPALSRMGKGVGAVKDWISYIKAGMILLELTSIVNSTAISALQLASLRLPLKTRIVCRDLIS